jgi:hypothetical protein
MNFLINIFSILKIFLSKIYIYIFSTSCFQSLNSKVIVLALHAQGYNNWRSSYDTGEKYFIEQLKYENMKFCVDIGANKGNYSRAILENTNADVIAFEPMPASYFSLLTIKEDGEIDSNPLIKGLETRMETWKFFMVMKTQSLHLLALKLMK